MASGGHSLDEYDPVEESRRIALPQRLPQPVDGHSLDEYDPEEESRRIALAPPPPPPPQPVDWERFSVDPMYQKYVFARIDRCLGPGWDRPKPPVQLRIPALPHKK